MFVLLHLHNYIIRCVLVCWRFLAQCPIENAAAHNVHPEPAFGDSEGKLCALYVAKQKVRLWRCRRAQFTSHNNQTVYVCSFP